MTKHFFIIAERREAESAWCITAPGFPNVRGTAERFADVYDCAADALETVFKAREGGTSLPAGEGSQRRPVVVRRRTRGVITYHVTMTIALTDDQRTAPL